MKRNVQLYHIKYFLVNPGFYLGNINFEVYKIKKVLIMRGKVFFTETSTFWFICIIYTQVLNELWII